MTTTDQISSKPVPSPSSVTALLGKLAYLAVCAAVVVLALTGIGTFLLGKAPMTHWVLMLHVGTAPVFAMGLAVVALLWAGCARCGGTGAQPCCAKALFWLILLSGLVVILSGVVPMTPLFGTDGQHTLYLTHRYSGMVLTAALALHGLNLLRGRK